MATTGRHEEITPGVLELARELRRVQNDYGLLEIKVTLPTPTGRISLALVDEIPQLMITTSEGDREVRVWPRSLDA
ncbi:MAG TPA: hypothetical protein VGG82_07800 [Casimicrobiaceae bacterium]|jgi:hypothetical protein